MLSKRGAVFIVLLLIPAGGIAQNIRLADSLASIGSKFRDQGKYREAEFYLSEAVKFYSNSSIQDTSKYIYTLFDYSFALYQIAEYHKAVSQLDILKPIVEQQKDTTLLATIHNYKGLILRDQNNFKRASNHFHKGLELSLSGSDSLMTAILYDNLAGLNRQMGNYKDALNYREQALDLYEEVGTDLNVSICLNNMGLTYIQLSMYDRAYEYLSRSLSLAENMGNTSHLTAVYSNLGMVHYNLGNYDQAMISYQKALENARQTGNPLKEAHLLVNLGNLYDKLGDKQKSLGYYQEGLKVLLNHNITTPSELSTIYKNIANRQLELGQEAEARQNYQEALELRKKTGNIREIALSYLDIARLELRRKKYGKAFKLAERGRQIADSMQIGSLMIKSYEVLGNIQRSKGDSTAAIRHFREAYLVSKKLPGRTRLNPLSWLAITYNEIGSDSALVYGEKLIDIIEENRTKVGELSHLKSGYFKGYSDFYVNLASWHLKYGKDVKRAYELVEASKARALLDELEQASLNLDEQLPVDTRLEKQNYVESIEELQSQIDTTSAPRKKQSQEGKLRSKELEYAAFMNQVRAENPNYKKLNYPAPISAYGAQQLVDDRTAILEYAFSDTKLLIFMITSDGIRVKQVDITDGAQDNETITRLVEQFRDDILAHAQREVLRKESSQLVQDLIAPFSREISDYSNLMIIPDGVLAYLPFEALIVDDQYLIEKHSVKYAPSLTTFSMLKDHEPSSYSRQLLAIAGSNFGGTTSALNRGKAYPPLPATIAEVDSIASKFNEAEVFKKGNFSEQFIKDNLRKNYRFVHLATHGIIDEDYPSLSGLALSSSPENASGRDDGMLRSSEIYRLNINSEMVVLSACNTGLGKMVNGEGMLGLQRAFFYAGVPTVSVSLWNVYDRSTAYFMDQFYSSLLKMGEDGQTGWGWNSFLRWIGWDDSVPFGKVAPAMRQAKLKMIHHPLYSHPIYWAPFIVVGR